MKLLNSTNLLRKVVVIQCPNIVHTVNITIKVKVYANSNKYHTKCV